MNKAILKIVVLFLVGNIIMACSAETANPTPMIASQPAKPSIPTSGNEYYVTVNEKGANDENNGLYPTYQGGQDGPWLTIQNAASTMTAGDVTYIRAGTYYESGIYFAHSGAPGAPITITNYLSEEVIIDGSGSTGEYIPGVGIIAGRDHFVIQGLTIRNMPWSGIYTDEETTDPFEDLTIRDCILHNNGWSGIDLAAVDGFVVENVEAYDNAFYGINISGSDDGELSAANGIVRNSRFYNHTGDEGHGLGINQGHDITVSDSVAYHNTIHGFDVTDWPKYGELSYNVTFERNFSYDNGMAGFAINSDSHHVVYRNNVAWRNGAAWAGQGAISGFWCYEGCWHVEWYNNVSIENSDSGFWVEEELGIYGTPGDNLLVFKNNIAYNNDPNGDVWGAALGIRGNNTWKVVATHNNWSIPPGSELAVENQGEEYTPGQINRGAFQTGNISRDPEFVDVKVPDVHLRSNSPCIDAGEDLGEPHQGAAPDMGAFESGQEGGQTGSSPTATPMEPDSPTIPEAPPPAAPSASDTSDWLVLQEGAQGPEVFALQYLLRFHGHATTVDGQYGPETREAVIAFQTEQGLDTDGVVGGEETWPALIEEAWVQMGDNGDHVFAVQYLLINKYEYSIALDSDFGPQTNLTVQQFQEKYNLDVDGIVGPQTWQALISFPAP